MTISIGLTLAVADASCTPEAMSQLVLCAADEALMASKADGRNKVTLGRSAA
jgi:GGDEF domain-containing protein